MDHRISLPAALAVLILALGTSGCVARIDYLQKQAEADQLHRELSAATTEGGRLTAEIERLTATARGLAAERDRLQRDRTALTADVERLTAEVAEGDRRRAELGARIARMDAESSRTLEELRSRSVELDGDRAMHAERIALLRRTHEAELVRVNRICEERLRQERQESAEAREAELRRQAKNCEEQIARIRSETTEAREAEVQELGSTFEELVAELKGEIAEGQVAITELEGKLTVDVVDRILFDSGQTELRPAGLDVLRRVVAILMPLSDRAIRIEGHTDSVPIGGALAKRYPTNWELSAARALNVTRYLERAGIDPARLSAVAFGEHRPLTGNDTPEGRAKNRRIAITLLPKE